MLRKTFLIALAGAAIVVPGVGAHATTAPPCQEDDACWTWSRMGDHHRGVVTMWGNPKTVGPCEFKRLRESGHVKYSVRVDGHTYPLNDRLRGDAWAMAHGCE